MHGLKICGFHAEWWGTKEDRILKKLLPQDANEQLRRDSGDNLAETDQQRLAL